MITRLSTLLLVFALTFLAFKVHRKRSPQETAVEEVPPEPERPREWHLPLLARLSVLLLVFMLPIIAIQLRHSDDGSPSHALAAQAVPEKPESGPSSASLVMERQDARSYGLARKAVPPPAAPTPAPTPAPTSAPTPAPAAFVAPPPVPTGGIEGLICSYAWNCQEALGVARCESGLRPTAIGGGSNYGLFQINQVHASRFPGFWELWSDPASNVSWAFQIWSASGWRPWGCRPY
ncbi:MAG: transglycosylase SLT domain-containing protein [Dehalococcoidia bacterium]